jgi:hypothetical protein
VSVDANEMRFYRGVEEVARGREAGTMGFWISNEKRKNSLRREKRSGRIDSKPPHGFSPYGHVANSSCPNHLQAFGGFVQTTYKPSVLLFRFFLQIF